MPKNQSNKKAPTDKGAAKQLKKSHAKTFTLPSAAVGGK